MSKDIKFLGRLEDELRRAAFADTRVEHARFPRVSQLGRPARLLVAATTALVLGAVGVWTYSVVNGPPAVSTVNPRVPGIAGGLTNPNAPLGPAGKKYTLTQARAAVPANRLVLPETLLTSNDLIQGIWATSGHDAETWIQYSTGIVVTEAVPPWDQRTAQPEPSSAPTDVASLGRAMLNDGSGMKGEVTQIDGVDAFVAYATDPSHGEGPGSIVVEVNGSVDSVIGTTTAVTMDDLYTITKALVEAGKAAAQKS